MAACELAVASAEPELNTEAAEFDAADASAEAALAPELEALACTLTAMSPLTDASPLTPPRRRDGAT